jgi:hypothetical protein
MPTLDIAGLQRFISMSRRRITYGLDRTPDDRLDWRPAPDAPSPLEMALRISVFATNVSQYIRTGAFPERREPPVATNREEAKTLVDAACAALAEAVAGITDEALERPVMAPWGGQVPLREMMWFIPGGLMYYQGQLNYLQLAYGDTDPNMPPNWGVEE